MDTEWANKSAYILGMGIRLLLLYGRWILGIGLIVFLAIYIRKKNKKTGGEK